LSAFRVKFHCPFPGKRSAKYSKRNLECNNYFIFFRKRRKVEKHPHSQGLETLSEMLKF